MSNVERIGSPLSPISDPIESVPIQTPRKRKHAQIDDIDCLGKPFAIKAHLSLSSSTHQHLTSRLLLPRSSLALAYLDPTSDHEDNHSPRLFSARIEILEAEHQERPQAQPSVLIVQSSRDGRLHVVERVQTGIYALCLLASWVTLRMLERLPVERRERTDTDLPSERHPAEQEWWRAAVIAPENRINADIGTLPGARKLQNVNLCLRRPVQTSVPKSTTVKEEIPAPVETLRTEPTLIGIVEESSQNPEEVLEMIRFQYLEALYASKTSLAYFAKGPLSRARATFHASDASMYDQSNLVQYLRANILPLTAMDTKYRDALPNLVKGLPFGSFSDEEGASIIAAVGKKTGKSKKIKVGKNGLYAGEDMNATRWWLGRDNSSIVRDSADACEDVIKATLLEQRARETQLQIILALETLALEASTTDSLVVNSVRTNPAEGELNSHKKPKKRKRPQDLKSLVEILADRLCIWQSMNIDEMKASSNGKKSESQHGAKGKVDVGGNDCLRQFCVDVILPFYGARLADLTTMLCEKLGGPKQPSPKRPPMAKALTSSAPVRPGSAMQRHQPRRPRRTLERVLTDERSASQRPAPSLLRSVTDPVLPKLKREESDTSLLSIPLNRVTMNKRYSQREVDLNAASQATEAKLKRKAKVEQELQGAITTLKRPNPRMAVRELVEDAERRAAGPHLRKSKNPARNPSVQGVQIMATPSKSRHHRTYAAFPRLPGPNSATAAPDLDGIPPSSISRISDSARRPPRSSPFSKFGTSWDANGVLPTIEQTPTRGSTKLSDHSAPLITNIAGGESLMRLQPDAAELKPLEAKSTSFLLSSLTSWPSNVQETPSKSRTAVHLLRREEMNIKATPSKPNFLRKDPISAFAATALLSSQEQEPSIYASLGWDDEADHLLS